MSRLRWGVTAFFVTGRGMSHYLPAHPVAHANDIGAGDSFASATALALAVGGSMEDAARIEWTPQPSPSASAALPSYTSKSCCNGVSLRYGEIAVRGTISGK